MNIFGICYNLSDVKGVFLIMEINNKNIKNKFERFYYLVWVIPLAVIFIIISLLLVVIFIGITLLVIGMPLWIAIAILVVIF